jgi:hypothetical protein
MDLKAQADMFRMQKPLEEVPAEWNLLQGMKCPMAKMPIFTWFNETNADCLGRTGLFSLYLNHAPPYPEVAGERAGMAFGHFLAVPTERIYNAATLQPGDQNLIQHMKDKVCEWMDKKEFRTKVCIAMTNKYVGTLPECLRDGFIRDLRIFELDTTGRDMDFYFHVHPNHSVGHLHMHCLTMNLLSPVFKMLEYKNVHADSVYIP